MNILLCNDDGYLAPGIRALADELSALGNITVVAPDRNRSAASSSLTILRPLRVHEVEPGWLAVDGTPTDCVHLAITGLLQQEPDVVISGINSGANMGDDVWYSGTVAAAVEGRYLGYPAIAVSLAGENAVHYKTAAVIAKRIVERVKREKLPPNTVLNVNVPDIPLAQLKGIRATRLGSRHKSEPVIVDKDPRNTPIYWIGPAGAEQDAGPDTDFYAVRNHYASVTPIHVDLTKYSVMDQLGDWLTGM